MLPQNNDLILKEKVKLHNNIAKINDCEGRLLAELEVYPKPRIIWEFEMLGNVECNFPYAAPGKSEPLNSLVRHGFSIDKPICTLSHSNSIGPTAALRGVTAQAVYGDMEALADIFTFYLPNTRFQHKSIQQGSLKKTITEVGNNQEVGSGGEGRYIESAIDNTWNIRLEIRKEALDWLEPNNRNIGTLITTVGRLYQPKYKATEPVTFCELQSITLKNAFDRLAHLCWFLSYANGGDIGPLYIQGYKYTQDIRNLIKVSGAVVSAFNTTPLEQLCCSWVNLESNLIAYLECFPTFERMIQNPLWKDTFNFTLTQYFQATRPGMTWEVVASAAGAALERLSYTILVEEETNHTKKTRYELLFDINKSQAAKQWNLGKNPGQQNISPTGKRLQLLLECMGLTKSRGYNDIDDVPAFLTVRNDAVHPRVGSMTIEQRWKFIVKAIQWIDEVLLWRIGYDGKYLDRTQEWSSSINPRYDLSLREPNW